MSGRVPTTAGRVPTTVAQNKLHTVPSTHTDTLYINETHATRVSFECVISYTAI